MLCYIFLQWEKDLQLKNTQTLKMTAPLHQVFIYKTHVLSPLYQF